MTYKNGIWIVIPCFRNHARHRHWPELRVEKLHLVSGVEQGSAYRKQAQGGQMLARNAAADGGVRWIEQEDFHEVCWLAVRIPSPGLHWGLLKRR